MKKQRFPADISSAERVSYLLAAYLRSTLTSSEQTELDNWLQASERNRELFNELTNPDKVGEALHQYNEADVEARLQQSKAGLRFSQPSRGRRLRPWFVAAAVAGLIILVYSRLPKPQPQRANSIVRAVAADIPPGLAQAYLNAGTGELIPLESRRGAIATGIRNDSGSLVYSKAVSTTQHELVVPKKGFYRLQLSDGSQVILNADSRLRYPASFSGADRRVYLEGEAYFEITHDQQHPFIVETGAFTVRDLGTAFTVSAYADEPTASSFLAEGMTEVSRGNERLQPKPGELVTAGQRLERRAADAATQLGWTRNEFHFTDAPVPLIMRQIARWYDADIRYQDSVTVRLNATIDRAVPVSRLLELLEKTNDVHFRIEGKSIIVLK